MSSPRNEPIAIIGTGCRFPGGSTSISKLWDLLSNPSDVSQEIGTGRFNLDRFYHKDGNHHGTTNTRRGYLMSDDIHNFDAKFFGISPGEAEAIDPQQRLLLEVVYEAMESAGITIKTLSGSDTAVYVGLMCQDFFTIQAQDNNYTPTYGATGSAPSNASSRISYFFDWHGPSMTIDTACSSSMVAVHEAIQSLRNGSSRVAVACGTNLMLSPFMYVALSKLSMLSPTGRCQMWDADADGYARGEGVASVVLKTLSAAIEDGDNMACVIREIGLNHDGRTKGITMPSATAQAALIRNTYARAGLDPTTKAGRCQFFEAHGTGTPAGDPQEAEGVSKAFFPESDTTEDELLVGSIKTIVGHTEGCAGLAGILKACLSIQHSTILPNLLFKRLNPKLEPFTSHLRIPTSCEPWPQLPEGTPRRASVNSFGFGGANAHCILESYMPNIELEKPKTNGYHPPDPLLSPLVFSAASLQSLISLLESTSEFLDTNTDVDISSLAYTLSTKRSPLSRRIAIYAASAKQLQNEIKNRLDTTTTELASTHSVVALSAAPSILGIFTGQGAQWPTMGASLVASNSTARTIMNELDQSLASLPACHRPSWTLLGELSADKTTSRVSEAAISQPLCTAVQIILVDLLRAAGVKFQAVVGHSSGEIAAAYAAGFIGASDAIRIAYYRGYFAKLAAGPTGEKGGMLAVGTDFEDASEFCEVDDIVDRLCVAAHNSPTSVTISGDLDAIVEAEGVFEEEKKFARVLKVDTAYHSAHMLRCSIAYQTALSQCCIQILKPGEDAPQWFSSLYNARIDQETHSLGGNYWVDNMTKPVLFYPAIKTCLTSKTINCALEIGPHPALQGPAKDSILEVLGRELPYSGTLKRGENDMKAFSGALGYLWTYFGSAGVDLGAFQQRSQPHVEFKIIYDLPSYPWTYDVKSWTESRKSKLFTTQAGKFHDLLGIQTADGLTEEWRWRNVLNPNELKWLSGHTLQGQVVFPGTGYIGLIMEAAMQIAQGRPVQSIDIFDLEIRRAIAIHDTGGTELLVSLTKVSPIETESETITADFTVFSTTSKITSQLALNCCGNVAITLGVDWSSRFSARVPPVTEMTKVDVDQFYQVMRDEFGFGYEGPFRGLTDISRRFGHSVATVKCHPFEEGETSLLFHPAMLDSALQGLQAAFSAPGDGRLWSIVAPTYFRRVTLIPGLCGENMTEEVAIDCIMTDPGVLGGDVDVYSANFGYKIIEMEGIILSPFAPATEDDDRHLFQESFLCLDKPDAVVVMGKQTADEKQKSSDAERAAFYFLKLLHLSVRFEEREKLPWYRQALIRSAERRYKQVQDGQHIFAPQSWVNDTKEEIYEMMDRYGKHDADFNMTKAVGENILKPDVLSGETNILEHMRKDVGLEQYYTEASGFKPINAIVSGVVAQLCNKHPRMNFLEIGAGTGGATGAILEKIGQSFSSYTYTDISSGFFERATERFQSQSHKIEFKTLDITKDPTSQEFISNSYDVVVASNVLHATAPLKETLKNTRKLLKPGGFLVLVELIRNDSMRVGQIMGGLPGWWCGETDGRLWSPLLTLEGWDTLLRETGFGGIETNSPMPIPEDNGAIIVAKAQNDQVRRLSLPLNAIPDIGHQQGSLLILGGVKTVTSKLSEQLTVILMPHFKQIIRVDHLNNLPELKEAVHVLSLTECDENMFEGLTEPVFEKMKRLFGSAESVLWLLQGSSSNLYAGVTLGFFRTICHEYSVMSGALLQTLDIESDIDKTSPILLAESVLQLKEQSNIKKRGESNQVLWNFEPELHLDNGQFLVPRIRQNEDQNARYNSSKRSITSLVDISKPIILNLVWVNDSYALREQHDVLNQKMDDYVTVRISCSYLASVKTSADFVFIGLGTDMDTGQKTICLSSNNSSVVSVPKSWTLRLDESEIVDGHFMSFLVADLMAEQVLRMLPPTGTVVAFEPDPVVSALLSKKMADKGRKILLITSRPGARAKHWLYLHPHSSQRLLNDSLPADVTLFADVSSIDSGPQSLGSRIAASLSPICEKINFSSIVAREASRLPELAPESVVEVLSKAAAFASLSLQLGPVPIADVAPISVLPLTQVISAVQVPNPSSLVYWQVERYVPVAIKPITDRRDLFRPDRTYWLAGLSGALGRSLADFMIAHNAKYVVLSSRTPNLDERWVQWHRTRGATITCLKGDVTDFDSIKRNYDEIKSTMPTLGGVANGAMVLRDGAFSTANLDDFLAGLGPKIQGTINLDRLFSEISHEPLDWFIGFSSLAAVIGNPGQSAYSAGNGCMRAVVNNRRSRGLAGSVIHISRITGIGYIERELTKDSQERLKVRSGTLAMSENDLHHLFAEGIIAGRPASGMNPELITGLGFITTEQAKEVFWSQNAKMGLLIKEVGRAGIARSGDRGNSIPVRKLLEIAKTIQEAKHITVGALRAKLQAMKFLPESDNPQNNSALVDLGIDSLIAVDTRSWFMREFGVDVPVMKILGGASMSDLVEFVFENLPQELLGQWESEAGQRTGTAIVVMNTSDDTKPVDDSIINHETENLPNRADDGTFNLEGVENGDQAEVKAEFEPQYAVDVEREMANGHSHIHSDKFNGYAKVEGINGANGYYSDTSIGIKLTNGLREGDQGVLENINGRSGMIEKGDWFSLHIDEVNKVDGREMATAEGR